MYEFQEIIGGPCWRTIAGGFVRRSQGDAHARNWLAEQGYAIVLLEHDNDCDGVEIMMARSLHPPTRCRNPKNA
jgi:hypothetical protein